MDDELRIQNCQVIFAVELGSILPVKIVLNEELFLAQF
jgi:hypothetical protein